MRRAAERSVVFVPAFLLGVMASAQAAGTRSDGAPPRAVRPPAPFGPEAQAQSEALRRREIDDLRRQDLAAALARLGEPLRWQDHPLRELAERRARVEAAEALRAEHGVTVDWHKLTLDELLDLRVRAAKGGELANAFGISIDWQRYSWIELEALVRTMRRMGARSGESGGPVGPAAATGSSGARLLAPTFLARPERERGSGSDPDAVIAPNFVAHRSATSAEHDPDAVIRPRFVPRPPPRPDDRDPDAVLRPRFARRPVVRGGDGPDDLIAPTFAESRAVGNGSPFSPPVDPDELVGPGFATSGR